MFGDSPVPEVTDEVGVVHLQLVFGHVLPEVHGGTVEEKGVSASYSCSWRGLGLNLSCLLFAQLAALLHRRARGRGLHQQVVAVVVGQEDVARFLWEDEESVRPPAP